MLNRLSLVLLLCLAGTFARAAAPAITSFAPPRGVAGTVVTITGTDLNGATTVAFNGVPVKAFNSNSATSLIALVPEGATTGKITVTNTNGTATSIPDFAVLFGLKNNPKDGASMLWVPGATFTMGTAADVGYGNEKPAHLVTLTGYWIYQYDVTVAQYRAFCKATGRTLPIFPSNYSWKDKIGWDDQTLQQHPMVNVSWNDAKDYADWAGVALPTEAQWEYAARGPQGRNYPWGGTANKDDYTNGWDATKCANYYNSEKIGKSTWPVGSFPAGASWCGAQDMAGNVYQWCGDWYGFYAADAVTNPTGPATGYYIYPYRVLRGGSWYYGDYYHIRSAYRYDSIPDAYNTGYGFRCVSIFAGAVPTITNPTPNITVIVPTITTIAPPSAVVGTVVTITGKDLDKATAVTFNGITAKTITDNTAAALKVTVPEAATSGKLTVTTAGGIASSKDDFIVLFGLKTNAKDNAEMVWVPGATFTMGSADGVGEGNEHPAHQVTLTGYWIYKNDVTVAQYRAFCTATTHKLPWFSTSLSWRPTTGWDDPALQQYPIANVYWNDAKAYADWAGVTLPTEAQWEYSARGPQGNNYPWGGTATKDNRINGWNRTKCANYDLSGGINSTFFPVGSFPSGTSWCGAQDMAGNVYQWCSDWYGDYTAAAVTNPTGPATGESHVIRGGSFGGNSSSCRSADRYYGGPDDYSYDGFRCVSLSPGP